MIPASPPLLSNRSQRVRPAARAAILLLGALGGFGCRSGTSTYGELPSPDASYTVRGRIVSLPSTNRNDLALHHEPIEDFRDARGETVGMPAMTMPFEVRDTRLIEGLRPGDVVELSFEVRWTSGPQTLATSVRALPQDTTLSLD